MQRKHDTILALDPGLRELGYAILSGKELRTAGVLSLRLVKPRRRIGRILDSLDGWIRAYKPRALVLEQIPKRPLGSLAGLPALGRRLRRLAAGRRIPIRTYSAKTVRRTVLGDGWAGKREVARVVTSRFPELRVHLTHDRKWKERYWQNMYDAIALALHHQNQGQPPSRSRYSD